MKEAAGLAEVAKVQVTKEEVTVNNQVTTARNLKCDQSNMPIVERLEDVTLDERSEHSLFLRYGPINKTTAALKKSPKSFHILRIPKDRSYRLLFKPLKNAPNTRINALFLEPENLPSIAKGLKKAYALVLEEYNELHQRWVPYSSGISVAAAVQRPSKLPNLDAITFRTFGQRQAEYTFPEDLKQALKGLTSMNQAQHGKAEEATAAVNTWLDQNFSNDRSNPEGSASVTGDVPVKYLTHSASKSCNMSISGLQAMFGQYAVPLTPVTIVSETQVCSKESNTHPSGVDEWPSLLSTMGKLPMESRPLSASERKVLVTRKSPHSQSAQRYQVIGTMSIEEAETPRMPVRKLALRKPQLTLVEYQERQRSSRADENDQISDERRVEEDDRITNELQVAEDSGLHYKLHVEEDDRVIDKLQFEEEDVGRVFWNSGKLQMARKCERSAQVSNQARENTTTRTPTGRRRRDVHQFIHDMREILRGTSESGDCSEIEVQFGQCLMSGLPCGITSRDPLQVEEIEALYTKFGTSETDHDCVFSNQLIITDEVFEDAMRAMSDHVRHDTAVNRWFELEIENLAVTTPIKIRLDACVPGDDVAALPEHVREPRAIQGAVYLHMPHKACNARFMVWKSQVQMPLTDALHRNTGFRELMESLYVNYDTETEGLELWATILESACDWRIRGVRLLTRFSSQRADGKDTCFCATKICDLAIIRRQTEPGKHVVCAFTKSKSKMAEEKRVWHEITLHISGKKPIIEEQESGSRNPRCEMTINDASLSALFHQTCVIMDSIDAVQVAAAKRSQSNIKQTPTSQQVEPGEIIYW